MQPMYYIGLDVHKRKISYCDTPGFGPVDENTATAMERGDGSAYVHGLEQRT